MNTGQIERHDTPKTPESNQINLKKQSEQELSSSYSSSSLRSPSKKLSYSKYSINDVRTHSQSSNASRNSHKNKHKHKHKYDDYQDYYNDKVTPSPIQNAPNQQFYFSGNNLSSYEIKPDQTCLKLDRLLQESATKIRMLSHKKCKNHPELQ